MTAHIRTDMRVYGAAALGLMLVACDAGRDAQPQPVQGRVALSAFESCQALETYIEDTAVEQMRVQLDSWTDDRGWGWGGPLAGAEDASAANDAGGATRSSGPSAYTTTNTQVEGVDEADFVKNDGTRIFVLSGQKLYAVSSWPAADLHLADAIEIQGWPREMFLDERGRVVVFSNYYPSLPDDQAPYWCSWGCGYQGGYTKITVIEARDETDLQVVQQYFLPGHYANARRVGDSVRVVVRDYLELPQNVRYWPEHSTGDWEEDRRRFIASLDDLKAENEAIIRARSLDDWLPLARRVIGGSEASMARSCGDFHRPNTPSRLGLASIATLDLSDSEQANLHMTTILGEVGEVFASQENLYIASPHWWWWPAQGQSSFTYLHKFDISRSDRARYVASGGVDGYVLNQFAMDEHRGFLRVATTIDRWIERDEWFETETTNRISVLAERSGQLEIVGATRDLADDERITSARFMGDRGYLVTFEQIDPLFTVDLANPTNPRIIGELKIPGFSSYLHPLDENNILAIGTYLPEPDSNGQVDWSQRHMKLNIYDVSDFANPRVKYEQLVGTAYGWSEAAWNHKAFNYFPERGMLAIPFSDFRNTGRGNYWDDFVSDLRLFHIDADRGITPRGSIDMREVYQLVGQNEWAWYYSPWIRRSVMADDFAYAISDAGIRVANMNAPSTNVATVLFEGVRVGR